ncbi:hypothetical protein CYMTET_54836 [Cymbomonas tetramitiformis]|uniref:Uncharacterized protein n=1 Tax=Cymbomonas tetramitiformis TaxID=36881 RepID=A0AAE0BFX7_9CHLO|nr:hypothetical protein CYMTET_54836 [Cymbomonas tetramitiformis]
MTGSSKSKNPEYFPPLPEKHGDGRASPSPAKPTTQEALLQQILEMQKQQGEIRRQQAEEHRLLREQLHRQAEIKVASEAKVTAKSGTSDSEGVAKTAEQLLRGGAGALRAELQFVEDRVYQAADDVVADEVLQQWLNDFDKNRGNVMLNLTSKNAASLDARAIKEPPGPALIKL